MDEFIKYVGLDVHGKAIAVAVADNRSSEVRFMGQIANTTEAMVKLVNQLKNVANDGVNNGRVRLKRPATITPKSPPPPEPPPPFHAPL